MNSGPFVKKIIMHLVYHPSYLTSFVTELNFDLYMSMGTTWRRNINISTNGCGIVSNGLVIFKLVLIRKSHFLETCFKPVLLWLFFKGWWHLVAFIDLYVSAIYESSYYYNLSYWRRHFCTMSSQQCMLPSCYFSYKV